MDSNTAIIILMFIFFGWIPILSFGKAISWCIESKVCSKCTCKECTKEREE